MLGSLIKTHLLLTEANATFDHDSIPFNGFPSLTPVP